MLKAARIAAGLDPETAAKQLGIGLSTLYRIEKNGTDRARDVLAMSKIYGMDQTHTEYLAELARRAGKRGWWAPLAGSTASDFQDYLGLEEDAAGIRTYESELIPALLQTRPYATEVTRRNWSSSAPSEELIERRVDLRMQRQVAAFGRDQPLKVEAVIHESMLRIIVGDPAQMIEQLNHLAEVSTRKNIDVRVIPSASGAHAGMQGAFVILDFPELIDPPVIYVEYLTGSLYLEEAWEIDAYKLSYERLRKQALVPDRSRKLIREIAGELAALHTG
jgi:transcriptional regulator with XRE-family HTH domain